MVLLEPLAHKARGHRESPSKTGRAGRQVQLRTESEDVALANSANERVVHVGIDETARM